MRARRTPSARGSRAPGEGLHRTPATCLAGTRMGMGTGPHCSKRHRARGFVQAQNCGTSSSTTKRYQSHGLTPCMNGLANALPKGYLWEMKTDNSVTRKDSSQRDSSQEDSSHLPQGRLHHPGCGKSRGGRTPWCILSLPRRSYPGAAAPSALLSTPACRDRPRDTQPQGHTQLRTFLSPLGRL